MEIINLMDSMKKCKQYHELSLSFTIQTYISIETHTQQHEDTRQTKTTENQNHSGLFK